MSPRPVPTLLRFSVRFYRVLLNVYPADHRRDFGPLMVQLFRDLCRDALEMGGVFGLVNLWLRTLPDLAVTALNEHLQPKSINPMNEQPTKVDRYELTELIGTGATGQIYRGHDPKTGREVAIKAASPKPDADSDISEAAIREWMKKEADVLTQLDHPAIPKCYGYFEEDNAVYVVTDFVRGKSMLGLLEEQPGGLASKDVIGWGAQICDFLTYMHSHQPKALIFRDMKPSNVIIDPNGRVYIVDFAIAEWSAGFGLKLIGTIGYAPPEQYAGKSDARADIYALGATLYHVLTGRDPREEHRAFLFHAFPPRSLNPAISEALETVILKAVEHKPNDRYQSADEMKAALLACL